MPTWCWTGQVYPRVYGGTSQRPPRCSQARGLSPRVRGNRALAVLRRGCPRSIPACTGEPAPPMRPSSGGQVYPRVYGGTSFSDSVFVPLRGLSPRVRGNRSSDESLDPEERSIPACTGEPSTRHLSDSVNGVYPRVYGGTPGHLLRILRRKGLSPRVRGNLAL